ncbi:DUF4157 domain-containing protein [Ruegeria sp. 2012CJ41-6]|uniref:DUF4157 domain-containing protein n=1 Tax=Ruegeria spongiae TaxID=2942209 RepID=A0ABT0Q759_9RHOB|nr:DUF4157 domain-containing protein [Ruegeria spongiae]MCL6285713.1 DUF4157 domain-containing protein [Ruegeria spongiae]
MALKPQDVEKIAEPLKGKKARLKKCDALPKGTKELKLPAGVKKGIEEVFKKAKLNKVRLHVGGDCKEVCKKVKAKAFTDGFKIFLAKPGDAKNEKLLAHELIHVLQQGNGKWPKPKPGKVLISK